MGNAGKYLLTIGVIFGLLYGIKMISPPKPNPDIHFKNSRSYFKEKGYKRGMGELIQAIKEIRKLERDMDLASRKMLEESIEDLEKVREELSHDSLVLEDVNISYSEALNALTEAEVKLTKALLKTDHKHDAMMALKYGMMHLKNTLRFTEGKKKEVEIELHDEINEILEDKTLTDEEIEEHLDHIITRLDSLHQDNLHNQKSSD